MASLNSRRGFDGPQVVREDYPEKVCEDFPEHVAPTSRFTRPLQNMKSRNFWLLVAVCLILIIGAVVGGAVGGVAARNHLKNPTSSPELQYTLSPTHSNAPPTHPNVSPSTSITTQPSATPTSGGQLMKLQYYWDGQCTNYGGEYVVYSTRDFVCTPWYQAHTWSGNIADCTSPYGDGCNCTFYTSNDCTGMPYNLNWATNGTHSNCAYNQGDGFRSFICSVLKIHN